MQIRQTFKTELSDYLADGKDVAHGFIFTQNFVGEAHMDTGDATTTALIIRDVGDCDRCTLEQYLCFPVHGFAIPLVDGRTTIFDGHYPHCASTIRKSIPNCPCQKKRCSIVVFANKRLLTPEKDLKKKMKSQTS